MVQAKNYSINDEEARKIQIEAATVFQPRTPIDAREFFAGRFNHITSLVDAVVQKGLHVVIYGERGVGKTSLANIVRHVISFFNKKRVIVKTNASTTDSFETIWRKLFREFYWKDNRPVVGLVPGERPTRPFLDVVFPDGIRLDVESVRRCLEFVPNSVFIIDEFDRVQKNETEPFTDLIKALSDFSVNSTVVLVGVSDTIDELIQDHASITRALTQVQLPRMAISELQEILDKASAPLEITFSKEASDLIVHISQGLPHYTHLLGLYSVRGAAERKNRTHFSGRCIRSSKTFSETLTTICYQEAL